MTSEAESMPEEIWLQHNYGLEGEHTWANHEIGEPDIGETQYTRTDTIAEKDKAIRVLREALGQYFHYINFGGTTAPDALMEKALSETAKFEEA